MAPYDRSVEDLGNIVALEHVNTRVPDQQLATLFYVAGLGLTRDPYLVTGVTNMWINVGRSQFHLPSGRPQVVRGHTGLVIPGRESLLRRLAAVRKPLEATRFGFTEHETFIEACPWGNRIRCFTPSERFGTMRLGMPYVEIDIARGAAAAIARFYREVLGVKGAVAEDDRGHHARIPVASGKI